MGELSKLLLGSQPGQGAAARARHRRARRADPRVRAARSGSTRRASGRERPLDEHIFRGRPARAEVARRCASPRCCTTSAKPLGDVRRPRGGAGREIADDVLERLRYPTRLRRHVVALVAAHAFHLDDVDELFARRFLREHGDELARDLVAHKDADLRSKNVPRAGAGGGDPHARAARRAGVASAPRRRISPSTAPTCSSSATPKGPSSGDALERLLDLVVEDPARNDRDAAPRAARRSWLA